MKGYSAFPKALELLESRYQDTHGRGYFSAEMQSMYSKAAADLAKRDWSLNLFPTIYHVCIYFIRTFKQLFGFE